jgi:hypothetical protein
MYKREIYSDIMMIMEGLEVPETTPVDVAACRTYRDLPVEARNHS